MQIPSAWLWISGIFFAVNIVFFIVLIFALIKLMEVAQEMKPKIERISDRVDSISEKVDLIAGEVQGRVKDIGSTSGKFLHSAETIAATTAQLTGRFAPYFAGFGLILKAYQMAKEHGVTMPKKTKALPARAKDIEVEPSSKKGK